jgi:hypothetical protein
MLRPCSYGVAMHPTSGCGLNDGAEFVTAGRILFARLHGSRNEVRYFPVHT